MPIGKTVKKCIGEDTDALDMALFAANRQKREKRNDDRPYQPPVLREQGIRGRLTYLSNK